MNPQNLEWEIETAYDGYFGYLAAPSVNPQNLEWEIETASVGGFDRKRNTA